MTKTILGLLLVASTAMAQPGSAGSGSAGSGSAGSGSATGSATPTAGSDAGSGSATAPTTQPPPPPADFPMPAGVKPTKVCLDEMDKDPGFADYIIKRTELKLKDKVGTAQVLKDQCTIANHQESQDEISTNKRHVLMAYIAMWLVAAGFLVFMWRKQQALKLEIASLRRDLDTATKDDK